MDYSKMFDNATPKGKPVQFASMFAGQDVAEPKKPEFNDLFKGQPTKTTPPVQQAPKIIEPTKNMFASKMTQEEKDIQAWNPNLPYGEYVEWTKKWDIRFGEVSEGNQALTSKMLDLTQDLSRHDAKQNALFAEIIAQVEAINKRLSPIEQTSFGFFKKMVEQPKLTDNELHQFVDTVQERLMNIKPKVDPFAVSILSDLIDRGNLLLRKSQSGILALFYVNSIKPDDDDNNRKIQRLESVKKLIEMSLLSLKTTETNINNRFEQLQDLKSVVVPTMLTKLNNLIRDGSDNTSMSQALGSLLTLKIN